MYITHTYCMSEVSLENVILLDNPKFWDEASSSRSVSLLRDPPQLPPALFTAFLQLPAFFLLSPQLQLQAGRIMKCSAAVDRFFRLSIGQLPFIKCQTVSLNLFNQELLPAELARAKGKIFEAVGQGHCLDVYQKDWKIAAGGFQLQRSITYNLHPLNEVPFPLRTDSYIKEFGFTKIKMEK